MQLKLFHGEDAPEEARLTKRRQSFLRRRPHFPATYPGDMWDDVTVYILCGHKRYTMPNGRKVWMHYIGATTNLRNRLHAHRNGTSRVKLVAAMRAQGIQLRVGYYRVFNMPQEGWEHEIELKHRANAACFCNYCKDRHCKQRSRRERQERQRRAQEQRTQNRQQKRLRLAAEPAKGKPLCKLNTATRTARTAAATTSKAVHAAALDAANCGTSVTPSRPLAQPRQRPERKAKARKAKPSKAKPAKAKPARCHRPPTAAAPTRSTKLLAA